MSWLHDKTTTILTRVAEAKEKKVFPYFRRFENVGPRVKIGSGSYLNFQSNDYLGLSQDPRLVRRAIAGTKKFMESHGFSHRLPPMRLCAISYWNWRARPVPQRMPL